MIAKSAGRQAVLFVFACVWPAGARRAVAGRQHAAFAARRHVYVVGHHNTNINTHSTVISTSNEGNSIICTRRQEREDDIHMTVTLNSSHWHRGSEKVLEAFAMPCSFAT